MIISDIVFSPFDTYQELSAKISPEISPKIDLRVWFKVSLEVGDLAVLGDAFVAGFLIPCMYRNENLHIDAPVSSRLLNSVKTIQSISIKIFLFNRTL